MISSPAGPEVELEQIGNMRDDDHCLPSSVEQYTGVLTEDRK